MCYFSSSNNTAIIISLSAFVLFLIAILIKIFLVINKYVEVKNPKGYLKNSTFVKYSTNDGRKIFYQVYRNIQCKKPILTEYEYGYKWSGTRPPKISSTMQEIGAIVGANKDGHEYDKVVLKFKTPILYNQMATVNFNAELDDSDNKSLPHVENKVEDHIQIIHIRIELKHKKASFNKPAKLLKRAISSDVSEDFVEVESIPFDRGTKSYEYHLINPEIGYFYRIRWEK